MKKVILKCRFGDHLPDPRVAVELEDEDAEYLIGQGLAEEPKTDTIIQSDNLPTDVKVLRAEVKDLQAEITWLNGSVETLTAERDNALTALALAIPPKGK